MNRCFFYLVLFTIIACKSDLKSQNINFDNFKKELSTDAFEKFEKNLPLPYEESVESSIKFNAYFNAFGNSGICVFYDLDSNDKKHIEDELKKYEYIDNKLLTFDNKSFVYRYENHEIPKISDDIYDKSILEHKSKGNYKVYLMDSGKIEKAFNNNSSKKNYYYSAGIYYFNKIDKLVYWYILY